MQNLERATLSNYDLTATFYGAVEKKCYFLGPRYTKVIFSPLPKQCNVTKFITCILSMNGHGTQSTKDQFLLPKHCVQYTEVGTLQDEDGCSCHLQGIL